eukprot:Gb_25209 [translate_table: standard]
MRDSSSSTMPSYANIPSTLEDIGDVGDYDNNDDLNASIPLMMIVMIERRRRMSWNSPPQDEGGLCLLNSPFASGGIWKELQQTGQSIDNTNWVRRKPENQLLKEVKSEGFLHFWSLSVIGYILLPNPFGNYLHSLLPHAFCLHIYIYLALSSYDEIILRGAAILASLQLAILLPLSASPSVLSSNSLPFYSFQTGI